jgi:hypothetical protein
MRFLAAFFHNLPRGMVGEISLTVGVPPKRLTDGKASLDPSDEVEGSS